MRTFAGPGSSGADTLTPFKNIFGCLSISAVYSQDCRERKESPVYLVGPTSKKLGNGETKDEKWLVNITACGRSYYDNCQYGELSGETSGKGNGHAGDAVSCPWR